MAEFKEISPNASAGAKLTNWFENRFPTMFSAYRVHMSEYYAPKNFNFWYIFGSLAMLVLVIQIVTGIFLVMHYKPDAALAFGSVEYIMRDVPWGWLIRTRIAKPIRRPNTPRTVTARSSLSCLWAWGFARTSVVRRVTSFNPVPSPPCPMTGKEASSAPATAPPLTWRAACSRTNRHRTTSKCRRTCTCPTASC